MMTCLDEAGFPRRETMEQGDGIVADLVYVQCDAEDNQYLLLESFVDQWKDDSDSIVANQKVVVKRRETNSKLTAE